MKRFASASLALAAAVVLTGCGKTYEPQVVEAEEPEWIVLFDGASTDAFRGYRQEGFPSNWSVENGELRTLPGQRGDIITRDQFTDYELQFEWKVSPGGNSGIIYNVAETDGPAWHTGPEMQILDDAAWNPSGVQSAGSLYDILAPNEDKRLNPTGEWNTGALVVNDGQVEHWLNGEKILQYEWDSPEVRAIIATTKFHDKPRFMKESRGHIAFQHHGEEVWFRNIRIRNLGD